jgi:signal transduction histidine kinase
MIVPYWGWRRLNAASGYLAEELRALERSVGGAVLARPASAPPPRGDLVLQQMTLLQEAKARISDLRRFVADILANFPDPVLVVDRDGRILTVNQAAADFAEQAGLSTTPNSPVQPILARIVAVTPSGGSAWPPPERDAANSRPFSGMGMAGRAYEVRFTATRSAGDEQTGWIIHLADITSLVSAMRQREEALQLLSHDMRSPQSAILATLSHPEFKDAPAALRQRIEGHARRTLELADAFVRLAKAESARYVLEPIDLAHVMQDAADAVWGLAQAAGVKVVVQVANDEDEYVILADRGLLTRALVNLLDNAVKFSPAGEKVVCSIGYGVLEGAPAIECRIADRAGGMSQTNAGSLFRKFASFRDGAHAPTGIGLGLALVHTVVTRHNGEITVESVEGEGSVFILKLPRHDEDAGEDDGGVVSAAALAAAELDSSQAFLTNGSGMRLAPWRANIQPGYSGGRALTSSRRATSSGERRRSTAARLSSSCSTVLAPMMMLITCGLASSHARATRATDTPCASPISRMAATQAQARSRSTGGKSKFARRASLGAADPGPNFPESRPPARGDQTIRPRRSSVSIGTSSRSRSRPAME